MIVRACVLLVAAVLLPTMAVAETRIAKVMTVDDVNFAINKSNPSQLNVAAKGTVNSSGWTNGQLAAWVYLNPPADGILDMDFIATQPDGIVLWVISPIAASAAGPLEPWMKGLRIHSATNSKEIKFDQAPSPMSVVGNGDGEILPWPWKYTD